MPTLSASELTRKWLTANALQLLNLISVQSHRSHAILKHVTLMIGIQRMEPVASVVGTVSFVLYCRVLAAFLPRSCRILASSLPHPYRILAASLPRLTMPKNHAPTV